MCVASRRAALPPFRLQAASGVIWPLGWCDVPGGTHVSGSYCLLCRGLDLAIPCIMTAPQQQSGCACMHDCHGRTIPDCGFLCCVDESLPCRVSLHPSHASEDLWVDCRGRSSLFHAPSAGLHQVCATPAAPALRAWHSGKALFETLGHSHASCSPTCLET